MPKNCQRIYNYKVTTKHNKVNVRENRKSQRIKVNLLSQDIIVVN